MVGEKPKKPLSAAIPLPWPSGFRPETLRPPLSVEFALFGSYIMLIGTFTEYLNIFLEVAPADGG